MLRGLYVVPEIKLRMTARDLTLDYLSSCVNVGCEGNGSRGWGSGRGGTVASPNKTLEDIYVRTVHTKSEKYM